MSDISEKILLRKQLLAKRAQLTSHDVGVKSQSVCQKIAELPEFLAAESIAYYYPIRNEVDPRFLFNQFPDKKWYLPLCQPDVTLLFTRVDMQTQMTQTTLGVWEPVAIKQLINLADLDCILLPVVGFNSDNYRLGYGKGYYDKTFKHFKNVEKKPTLIGLAYDWQHSDRLPVDEWDIPLDRIVSD